MLGHLGLGWVMGAARMTHALELENIGREELLGHLGHRF